MFDDPEYDPNLDYDPPLRHDTPPSVAVEGADDDPTTRVWTEIEVIDPLDPSLAIIIVRTSQNFESSDDDDDLISDILPPTEDSIEDNASSDIDNPVEHLPSDQEDVPPLINYSSPVPPPVEMTCDITAHTVLLYVLFCLTYMYCTLYVLYKPHTVHTVHVPCFPVSDVEVSSSTSVHTLVHTLVHIYMNTLL